MMSVNFGTIQNVEVPGSKTVLVPLSASDSGSAQINYTFDPVANLQMELLSQSSKSLKLHIQASNGATFLRRSDPPSV